MERDLSIRRLQECIKSIDYKRDLQECLYLKEKLNCEKYNIKNIFEE